MWIKNRVDSDQLASLEASRSESTLFSKGGMEYIEIKRYVLFLL